MADIIAEGPLDGGSGQNAQATTAQSEYERHAWKLAKSLVESARSYARARTNNVAEDWRFFCGENHYPVPDNYRAILEFGWRNRGVRNWLFATVDHKAAVVLDAEPRVHVEPLYERVSFIDRIRIASAIRHELRRLNVQDLREDMFYWGAVTGVGLLHTRVELDPLTQKGRICVDVVHTDEFYHDPSASRLDDCRFVVWDPVMDMSDIRQAFPEKAHLVKADSGASVGNLGGSKGGWTASDTELITGTGREFSISREGAIESRRARVSWVWVKDEELVTDVEKKVIREEEPGYQCVSCGAASGADEAMPQDGSMPTCPTCGSTAMNDYMLPEVVEDVPMEPRRRYPYGRLMVIAGDVLLYDGPNPHQIEEVFPFVVMPYYRIPGRFLGYGDVALLRSAQRAANRNMAMAIDYMRLCANGMFEFPASAEAYHELGVGPGQLVQVPDGVVGLARWVHPSGYDVTVHQMVDSILYRDFQNVGGVSDTSLGLAPASPTSGVEVRARQAAASTRIGQHLRRLNQATSRLASLVWQLMVQHYPGDRYYVVPDAFHNMQAIQMDVSTLPTRVAVQITCDPDDIERDNLMSQNLTQMIATGQLFSPELRPFLDLYLVANGLSWNDAQEMKERVMYLEAIQAQAEAMAQGPGMGQADTGGPPTGPTGAAGPRTSTEAAQQAYEENLYAPAE